MIITCPECASEFDVPLAMIGIGGRTVRCASCRHEWFAEGPKPVENVESHYKKPATPVSTTGFEIEFDIFKNQQDPPSFMTNSGSSSKKSSSKKKNAKPFLGGKAVALGMAIVMVSLLGGIFVVLKPLIANASPEIARIYRGMGMDVPMAGQGLGIDRLILKPVWGDEGNTVEISTKLVNLTESIKPVPAILVEVMDDNGKPSGQSWRFEPEVKELQPQESVPFVTKLPEMPKTRSEVLSLKASFTR